jgi:phosphoenolpyruvate carboxykinase (GTP)
MPLMQNQIVETVRAWVAKVAADTQPAAIQWCNGSEEEGRTLTELAVAEKKLLPLNADKLPGCYLTRSDPSDVARTEHLTFICTDAKEDAGPTNNWMSPADARAKVGPLFTGAMRGRTLYVIPFIMGPPGSPFAKVGVQITDSLTVVLNMRIMTRVGTVALDEMERTGQFVRCLHSLGDLSPDRRFVLHFPQNDEIWSVGSGYGGNALLGKKCLALRLASFMGREQGWLAEHMLILGVQNPQGETRYIAAAFPSACGKTNLAMLVAPEILRKKGWRIFTVGDDIAWMRVGADGRLYAVNPEAGFFGVAPGTSSKTNPNAMTTISRNTLYTNVALRPDNTVWWEGHDDPPVPGTLDWQGRPWDPSSGEKAAHPNSRFTAPAGQCPSISPEWQNPNGVPIDAIIFGARRRAVVPLVYEARSWAHGTFLGATLSSETTAAATGKVGVLRRDPMAMLPFCGYNMADYWGHWLAMGRKMARPPKVFRVNWFRRDDKDQFLWPGFGENLRVLMWILERCAGRGAVRSTPLGNVPTPEGINREGLDLPDAALEELLSVNVPDWEARVTDQRAYLETFGTHVPPEIWAEHNALAERLHAAAAAAK